MDIHTKYSAAITTTLLLTGALAVPAQAAAPKPVEPKPAIADTAQTAVITAPTNIPISFERPAVASEEAPAPTPVLLPQAAEVEPVPAVKAPTPAPTTPPVQTAPAVASSGKGAAILAAAQSQIGVAQDCTRLVSNSLAAVGIFFHGWPWQYASLGTPVATPEPGDILIYADAGAGVAHVAIYAGGGRAIHGGFNGTTVEFSANVGSGYTAYRVA